MIKEEDSYMKVNPVGPSIPFRMRLKNTDNQTNKSGVKSKANPSFKEVMKQVECQPIRPVFKGHWPPRMIPNPNPDTTSFGGIPPIYSCVPPANEESKFGRLNFNI